MRLRRWFKVRKRKYLKASVSLLAAAMIGVITLTALMSARALQYQQNALMLHRLVDLQSEQILSLYERQLLEEYGLWAFAPETLDYAFNFEELRRQLPKADYRIEVLEPLADPEVFQEQSINFAKKRLPLKTAAAFYERLQAFSRAQNVLKDEEFKKAKGFLEKFAKAPSADFPEKVKGGAMKSPGQNGPSLAYPDQREEEREEEQSEAEREREEKRREAEEMRKSFSSDLKDAYKELYPEEYVKDDQTIAAELSGILDQASNFLDFSLPPFAERFVFHEYILQHFTSAVRGPGASFEAGRNYRSLSGKLFSECERTEKYEAECIIFGTDSSKAARLAAESIIISTRLALRYAAEINNETKMALHKAKASALSAAAFVASLGTLEIDPEALSYLFALIPAIRSAADDLKLLKNGGTVPLYPDPEHVLCRAGIYYTDYLRLFMLLRSDEALAGQAASFMIRNTSSYPFCAIRIEASLPFGRERIRYERTEHYVFSDKE